MSCGRFICGDCRKVSNGRNYCASCVPQYVPASPLLNGGIAGNVEVPGWKRALGLQKGRDAAAGPAFPEVTWKWPGAILIYLLSFGGALLAEYGIYYGFLRTPGYKVSLSINAYVFLLFAMSVVFYSLLMGMTFYSVKVRHGGGFSALGLKWTKVGSSIGLGVAGAYGAYYVAGFFLRPIMSYLRNLERPHTDTINATLQKASSGGVKILPLVLLVVVMVVLAPVCEEIFFRGYLYPTVRNRMSLVPAMLISGLLFGLSHMDIIYITIAALITRTLFGVAMCWVYENRRTLVGPIAGHAFINGFLVLIAIFLAQLLRM